jgi:hypothetical protein
MSTFGLIDISGNTFSYSKVVVYGPDGKVKYPSGGGGSGTVTSVGFSAGIGISLSGTNPITTSGIITIINSAPDQTVVLTASTGISVSGTYPSFTLTNTLPDQVVALTAGTSIGITGTYPNFTISNLAPDVTVALTAGTGISISGTYPNFTITNTSPSSGGTVTSVQLNAGTGISLSGTNPITASGIITITNSAPDQIVALTAGTGIGVSGTYPNFTITNSAPFTSPLTTKGDIYVRNATVDTRLPIGLDTQILVADSSTPTGLKWASQPAATPLGYYGAWQDQNTQTAAVANTGYAMKFRTTDVTPNGISIVSDTRITFANTGIYNLQFSSQFQNTNNQLEDVTIWLRLNGTDIPGTSGFVSIPNSHGGTPGHTIAAWNYVVSVVGGQYYELIWSTTNASTVTMQYYAAGSPPPAAASVILTVTQQSGIMAGTGVTAINSLTGAVQTLSVGTSGSDFAIVDSGADHKFNLPTASSTNRGALSSTDWSTFNGKQNAITLTTTGSSGASTFLSNTLNVPTYTLAGLGGVPTSRTLTINGTSYDLSSDRSWTISSATSIYSQAINTTRYDNMSLTGYSSGSGTGIVRLTNATIQNTVISGIQGGSDGRELNLENSTTSSLILLEHDSPNSTSANRIWNPDQQVMFLRPGETIKLVYNSTGTRWEVQGVKNYQNTFQFFDDLYGAGAASGTTTTSPSNVGNIYCYVGTSATSASQDYASTYGHANSSGNINIALATTLNSRGFLGLARGINGDTLTDGVHHMQVRIAFSPFNLALLSNGLDYIRSWTGYGQAGPSTIPAQGAYWLFLNQTYGSVLQCVMNNGSGGVTTVSSFTYTGGYVNLGLYIHRIPGSVTYQHACYYYSLDGQTYNIAATITTNLPSGGFNTVAPITGANRETAGTNVLSVYWDYFAHSLTGVSTTTYR